MNQFHLQENRQMKSTFNWRFETSVLNLVVVWFSNLVQFVRVRAEWICFCVFFLNSASLFLPPPVCLALPCKELTFCAFYRTLHCVCVLTVRQQCDKHGNTHNDNVVVVFPPFLWLYSCRLFLIIFSRTSVIDYFISFSFVPSWVRIFLFFVFYFVFLLAFWLYILLHGLRSILFKQLLELFTAKAIAIKFKPGKSVFGLNCSRSKVVLKNCRLLEKSWR